MDTTMRHPTMWGTRTRFNPVIANKILRGLMKGFSLHTVCKKYKDVPTPATILGWVAKGNVSDDAVEHNSELSYYKAFRKEFLEARNLQSEAIYAQIEEIEDKVESEKLTPQQGKMLVASKQKRLEQMNVERYGRKWIPEEGLRPQKVVHEIKVHRELIETAHEVEPLRIDHASSTAN